MKKIQIKKCYPYCLSEFEKYICTRKYVCFKYKNNDLIPLKNFTHLNKLWLSHNQITDTSPLKNLINLKELYLWSNQISEISSLENLINLKILELSNNKITDVSSLKNLVNLEDLYLDNNPIPKQKISELQKALPKCEIHY